MDILSLIGWRTDAVEPSGKAPAATLAVGDRLQGRVARLLSRDLALVDLLGGRFKAIAELKTPLNTGQQLNFKVMATTPRLTLQVLQEDKGPPSPGAPSTQASPQVLTLQQTRSLIGELRSLSMLLRNTTIGASPAAESVGAAKLATALERLAAHLTPLDPQGELKTIAAKLQAHLRDGGQLLLPKLVAAAKTMEVAGAQDGRTQPPQAASATPPKAPPAQGPLAHPLQTDLKPHLQRLLIHLPTLMDALDPVQGLSPEGGRHLWSTVGALLETAESDQTRLTQSRGEDPPVVMRHSMWVEGRDTPLHLNLYLPPKGRKRAATEAPMVSLLLDLQRFGAVRVDVKDHRQALKVEFWMDTPAARDALTAAVAPLEKILEALYPQVALKVALSPDKIAAFETGQGPSKATGSPKGRLDIRV